MISFIVLSGLFPVYRLAEDDAFQRKVMLCTRNFIGVLALQGNYECIASGA